MFVPCFDSAVVVARCS